MPVKAVYILVVAGTAAVMDLRTARVDNGWILFSLIMGYILKSMQEGAAGLAASVFGMLLPVLLLGMLFYFRALGPGDVKLFCSLGVCMGPEKVLSCILVSFLIGAVLSLAILLFCGGFAARFRYLFSYISQYVRTGIVKPYYKKGMSFENIHFTVPIFFSVLLYAGGVY